MKKDGNVQVDTKDEYDYSLNTNKRQKAKNNNDYKTWLDLSNKQLDIIDRQLQDPTLDELEQSNLLKKADTIIRDMQKYQGYGGFKKGYGGFKKGKKAKKATALSMRTVKIRMPDSVNVKPNIKVPTLKIKVPNGNRGTITKVNLPRIRPRVS